jgi:hypothetical protein
VKDPSRLASAMPPTFWVSSARRWASDRRKGSSAPAHGGTVSPIEDRLVISMKRKTAIPSLHARCRYALCSLVLALGVGSMCSRRIRFAMSSVLALEHYDATRSNLLSWQQRTLAPCTWGLVKKGRASREGRPALLKMPGVAQAACGCSMTLCHPSSRRSKCL